jgi:hypothetical protein
MTDRFNMAEYEDWKHLPVPPRIGDFVRVHEDTDFMDESDYGGSSDAPRKSALNEQEQPQATSRPFPAWPELDPAALRGPAGAFALAANPHTEADTVGIRAGIVGLTQPVPPSRCAFGGRSPAACQPDYWETSPRD